MIKRISLSLVILALVAGCSSGVKLNDVPVEDKGASGTLGAGNGSGSAGASQSGVTPVDIGSSAANAAGPQNVARIVYFDFDSYVIRSDFQSVIEAHSRFLKANPARKVVIEGHTDDRGGREYNLALGQRRAEAVRRSLGLLGVTDNQVEAVSFARKNPQCKAATRTPWHKTAALKSPTADECPSLQHAPDGAGVCRAVLREWTRSTV